MCFGNGGRKVFEIGMFGDEEGGERRRPLLERGHLSSVRAKGYGMYSVFCGFVYVKRERFFLVLDCEYAPHFLSVLHLVSPARTRLHACFFLSATILYFGSSCSFYLRRVCLYIM